MVKFTEKQPITCKCGKIFTGQNHVTLDDKGNVIKRERVNVLNGMWCPTCNVEAGLRGGK